MVDPFMFGAEGVSISGTYAANAAAGATSAANRAERTSQYLEDRVERLSLVCMAMWSLIQDKTSLTENDLLERVRTLDMIDGVADGKATRGVTKCANCGRVLNERHQRCMYCGAEKLVRSAFDAI